MSEEVQDAGADTTEAGGTQNVDTQGQKPAGQTAENKDATKPEGEVDYKFEAPEGVEFNQDDLAEFTSIAKELKLPADAAKKFVDLAAKREVARLEAFAKQVEDWGTQVKADKELGTPENLATAKRAIDTFGTPELRDLLNSTGMGNHPEVIRLALKVGKAISEDKVISGRDGGNTAPRDPATVLYGNTPN
jgi:hypothetical protein